MGFPTRAKYGSEIVPIVGYSDGKFHIVLRDNTTRWVPRNKLVMLRSRKGGQNA